jgi:hypothetical protein
MTGHVSCPVLGLLTTDLGGQHLCWQGFHRQNRTPVWLDIRTPQTHRSCTWLYRDSETVGRGAHSPGGGFPSIGDCVRERTYAWFGHYRRLSKDYEFLATTSEVMLYAAMVRRLKPKT